MNKHLTFDDRITIEQNLANGTSLSEIAKILGKNRTTISREILKHRELHVSNGNKCIHRSDCSFPDACPQPCGRTKVNYCRTDCNVCIRTCDRYEEEQCGKLQRSPHVCNGCVRKRRCFLDRWFYHAKRAQKEYEAMLRESREGISLTEKQLRHMDDLISPLLLQGQSIEIACNNHRDELPVSSRTVYSYVDAGLLSAKNIDLPRKVRRRPERKKTGPVLKVDKKCHLNRTYEDFKVFMEKHPDFPVVQGDSVEGKKGGKVLLTLHLTNCDLQLAFLREHNDAASVTAAFQKLRDRLGHDLFRRIFRVLLVDRGSEFTDPIGMEADRETGEILCSVFYCDPQNSNQKSNCERNHEFIREVIPKGKSMDHLTQNDIDKMMSHINSYKREKWNMRSPLEVFIGLYGQETADSLSLKMIDPDSILLKPELLK